MGTLTSLDAVVLAPAAILGLLGLSLGLARSLVAWPMRWLIPLLGACAAALLAMLYLDANREFADLLHLSGSIGTAVFAALAFLAMLWLLVAFMANLKERVRVWTGARRTGLIERVLGGIFGAACGLLLAVAGFVTYQTVRPEQDDPAWLGQSTVSESFRNAAETVRSGLLSSLPFGAGRPRR